MLAVQSCGTVGSGLWKVQLGESDLGSDLFSGAQRVELTQSRFSKGSAGSTRSWMGAAAAWGSSPQSQA